MNTQTLVSVPAGVPGMIHTTRGFFPECLTRKEVVTQDFPDALVTATEYYVGSEQVRRDVNLALKTKAVFDLQAKF